MSKSDDAKDVTGEDVARAQHDYMVAHSAMQLHQDAHLYGLRGVLEGFLYARRITQVAERCRVNDDDSSEEGTPMSVNENYPIADNDARCAGCGKIRQRDGMMWDVTPSPSR